MSDMPVDEDLRKAAEVARKNGLNQLAVEFEKSADEVCDLKHEIAELKRQVEIYKGFYRVVMEAATEPSGGKNE